MRIKNQMAILEGIQFILISSAGDSKLDFDFQFEFFSLYFHPSCCLRTSSSSKIPLIALILVSFCTPIRYLKIGRSFDSLNRKISLSTTASQVDIGKLY